MLLPIPHVCGSIWGGPTWKLSSGLAAPDMATSTVAFPVSQPKPILVFLHCLPGSCSEGSSKLCTRLAYFGWRRQITFFLRISFSTRPHYKPRCPIPKTLPGFLQAFKIISHFIHRNKVAVGDSGFLKMLWGIYLKMPNSWWGRLPLLRSHLGEVWSIGGRPEVPELLLRCGVGKLFLLFSPCWVI